MAAFSFVWIVVFGVFLFHYSEGKKNLDINETIELFVIFFFTNGSIPKSKLPKPKV